MNIDFHYYATYYAAILAGFHEIQAKKIAWAAEMVDELGYDLAHKNKELLGDDYLFTIQNSMLEQANNAQFSDSYDTDLSQGIRGIWVPFHFLPGHFDGGYHEVLAKSQQPYDTQKVTDYVNDENVVRYMDECLRLRCAPNSETVYELLKYVKGVYSKQPQMDTALYAIGVGMHVFADTWAHDDFSGVPCYMVNKVCYVDAPKQKAPDHVTENLWNSLTEPIVDDGFLDVVVQPLTNAVNSAIYTGHGQIGRFPDFDFMKYNYYPRYKCPPANMTDMIQNRNKVTRINNSERFWDAFMGLCNAMYYIRGEATEYIPKDTKVFGGESEADQLKAELMKNIFTAFPNLSKKSEKDYEMIIKSKVVAWRGFLDLKKCTDIIFDVEYGNLKEFAKQAKAYRNHILGFIDNKLLDIYGGPPIFDFWVPAIDRWTNNLVII